MKKLLLKFLSSAKKNFETPSYKDLFGFAKTFSSIESMKNVFLANQESIKHIRKNTTEPGDEFDASLCYCRVWNKGFETVLFKTEGKRYVWNTLEGC